jgi:hypothetical protein
MHHEALMVVGPIEIEEMYLGGTSPLGEKKVYDNWMN